jgi:hypothetical protein
VSNGPPYAIALRATLCLDDNATPPEGVTTETIAQMVSQLVTAANSIYAAANNSAGSDGGAAADAPITWTFNSSDVDVVASTLINSTDIAPSFTDDQTEHVFVLLTQESPKPQQIVEVRRDATSGGAWGQPKVLTTSSSSVAPEFAAISYQTGQQLQVAYLSASGVVHVSDGAANGVLGDTAFSESGMPVAKNWIAGCADGLLQTTQHLFVRDSQSGALVELWRNAEGQTWSVNNLSAATGSPPVLEGIAPTITAYTMKSRQYVHVVYIGQDQHLWDVWQSSGGAWSARDISLDCKGPSIFTGGVFGFVGGFDADQHIVAVALEADGGHLWHFACLDGASDWVAQDLTQLVGGLVTVGSTPVGARICDLETWGAMPATPPAGHSECHIFAVRADGHIVELWSADGFSWQSAELSSRINLPLPAVSVACYVTDSAIPKGRIHVVAQTKSGQIWETSFAHGDANWTAPQLLIPEGGFGTNASLSPQSCCVTGKTSTATSDDERNRYAMQFPTKATLFLSTDQLSAACYSWSGLEFIHAPYNGPPDLGHEGAHFMHLPHPFPGWWIGSQTSAQAIAIVDSACAAAGKGATQLTSSQVESAIAALKVQLDGDTPYGITDTPPDWGDATFDPNSPVPKSPPSGYVSPSSITSSKYVGPNGARISLSIGCADIVDYNYKVVGVTKISPQQRAVMLWALQVGNRRRLVST